ncbi:uncharacterized protein LOC131874041 [Cryptomeria japonica]|uniref:uncharacterized protein LOC131874041 n=1 Tax=Cryptomeria japonica TaxID=3369 RepID=UPI0027DAA45E|nr:uncharacterized protein LOC131874041 [Cryptomeria japonica]
MSSGGHRWILAAMDYFTKWVEAMPTRQAKSRTIINFLIDNVITRFGVTMRLIMDNAVNFRSEEFTDFCKTYGIIISHASLYHPQSNRLAESSNKSLMKSIKRTLGQKKKAWDSKLKMAIWADRITIKKAIGRSPFELVYGTHARLPMNNFLPVYKFIQVNDLEIFDPMKERMEQIMELHEIREDSHKKNPKLQ